MPWGLWKRFFGNKDPENEKTGSNTDIAEEKKYSLSKTGFIDHIDPKLMSEEELKMAGQFQKFDDTGMEIKEFDNVDTQNVLIDGQPAHASQLAAAVNYRPEADNFVIPGQRKKTPPVAPLMAPKRPIQQNEQAGLQGVSGGNHSPRTQRLVYEGEEGSLIPINAPEISSYQAVWTLAELEDGFYFGIDLPGLDKSMIKVAINEQTMTISGEYPNLLESMRQDIRDKKGLKPKKDPIVSSKSNINKPGKFKYPFKLSRAVDKSGVSATMTNGILKIMLPFSQMTEDTEITVL
jgi:HSP20 family molecular chaperone IbpA